MGILNRLLRKMGVPNALIPEVPGLCLPICLYHIAFR
jgi:hypothetical protein